MRKETIDEQLHGAAPITPIDMLLHELPAQLAGVISMKPGIPRPNDPLPL
ncbi:hypothetical protein ACWEKR_03840 [Nocardia sp. NPDC004573]